ncbi:DUF4386 domain-containing protein [Streptomyces sp. NPDC051940]|uniref:DUF4386 domain-containing protein n=1 Tax=Streptomyces sp. NPDC051940 TaxID=3155675 RepID=UPI003423971D
MTVTTTRQQAPGALVRRPLLPVLAYVALTAGYVAANRDTPHPDASGSEVLEYAASHGTAITLGAVLLAAAAIPLVLAATALLRGRVPRGAVRAWALGGAGLAGIALVASAVFAFLGGRLDAGADPDRARELADWSFLAGGPAFAVGCALFLAATAVAAGLPRAARVTGFVLAAAGLLSVLTVAADAFGYLLPLVRFGGLIWLVAVTVTLRRGR